MYDERVRKLELYAWVGEDELGSGAVGLKQGLTPAGMIPLVATSKEKAAQEYIVEQMQAQAVQHGKVIRLVRLTFADVTATLNPGR